MALGGQLRQAHERPGRMTLREHTRRYTAVGPPMSVLLDFLMNDEIDRPVTRWQEAFLPDELERQVAEFQVTGEDGQKRPLVAKSVNFYEARAARRPPTSRRTTGRWLRLLGLRLGGGALAPGAGWRGRGGRAPRVLLGLQNAVVGLVFGLPGLALFIMWLVTDHTVTCAQREPLPGQPAHAAGAAAGRPDVRLDEGARAAACACGVVLAGLGVLGLLLKALPMFDQDNWRLIALLLPISLGWRGRCGSLRRA